MATDSLGTLTVDLIANTGSFERGMDKAERKVAGATKAFQKQGEAAERLVGQIDPVVGAMNNLVKQSAELERHWKAGLIPTSDFERLNAVLGKQMDELGAANTAFKQGAMSAKQYNAALRTLPAQFTDIATSLAAGQNPLQVFLQQGGQIKDSFGGAGAALKAMGGYLLSIVNPATVAGAAIAGLGVAYYDAFKTQQEFNQALYAGNGTIGVSASQLQNLSKQAGLATGSIGSAEEAFQALAAAGNLSTTQLENFGEAAAAISQYSGKSAGEVAKSFAQLGDNATDAAQKISQQYGLITAEQYEVIKSIDEQGDSQSALDQLSEDLNNNALERLKTYRSSLTEVERDWDDIKSAISRAYAEVKAEIFPDATRQAEIIQRQIDYINAHPVLSAFTYAGGGSRDEVLQQLEGQKKALIETSRQQEESAKSQADLNKANQEYIKLSEQLDKRLSDVTPETKKAKAVADLNKQFLGLMQASATAGKSSPLLAGVEYDGQSFSGGAYDQLLKQINEQGQRSPRSPRSRAYTEDAGQKMLDSLRQQYAAMQAQSTETDKLGQAQQALIKWEQQLADIKSKQTLTADQKSLLANSDLITAQLKKNAALEQELDRRKDIQKSMDDYAKLVDSLKSTEEKQLDVTKKRFEILERARANGLSDQDYQNTARDIIANSSTKAPNFAGIDASIGGAGGEMEKINEAQNQLEDWYQTQLQILDQNRRDKADLTSQWDEQELALKQEHEDKMQGIEKARQRASLAIAEDIFGNLAVLAQSENKKLVGIGKAAAIAQATISGFLAIQNALAVPPYPLGLALAATAAVSTAANVAAIAGVGFRDGGYTGNMGVNDVAGVVHGKEFVFDAEATSRIGVSNLEAIRSGKADSASASIATSRGSAGPQININQYGLQDVKGINQANAKNARTIARVVGDSQRYT